MRDSNIILSKIAIIPFFFFLKKEKRNNRGLHYWHIPQYSYVLSNNQEKNGAV